MAVVRRMPKLDTSVLVTIHPHLCYGLHVVFFPEYLSYPAQAPRASPRHTRRRCTSCTKHSANKDGDENKRVSFQRMLEQLTSGRPDGCLVHLPLAVQLSPRFAIDDAKAVVGRLRLRLYFRTASVERAWKMPQMPLSPCCIELDEGPGGSCTWMDRF